MKHLQKIAWLGGLLVTASGLIASPAYAGDLDVTGKFSMSGKLPLGGKFEKITEEKLSDIGFPLDYNGKLGFEKTFDLEEGSIDGVLKLKLIDGVDAPKILEELEKRQQGAPDIAAISFKAIQVEEAYLDYGILRMGIAKSMFSDEDSVPTSLMIHNETNILPQIRWTFVDDALTYALAAETGKYAGKGLRLPHVVGGAKYEIDEESHVKFALGANVSKPGDEIDFKVKGLVAGRYGVLPELALMGQVQVSEIAPSKIKDITKLTNILVGGEYQFAPEVTGTLAWGSKIEIEEVKKGGNAIFNVMYDMTSNLSIGGEFGAQNLIDESRDMNIMTVVSLKL